MSAINALFASLSLGDVRLSSVCLRSCGDSKITLHTQCMTDGFTCVGRKCVSNCKWQRSTRPAGRTMEDKQLAFLVVTCSGKNSAACSRLENAEFCKKPFGDVITRAKADSQIVSESSESTSPEDYAGEIDRGQNGGSNHGGTGGFGGNGDDGGESGEERNVDGEEFGPVLNAEQVQRELKRTGVTLPSDMLEAANTVGIRKLLLSRYIELQGAAWPLGSAIKGNALLRNRMLADPTFLFKVFTEIAIDSGCATFAEVQKRGKDFWNEFELYLSDLSVGIVLDVALVGLLAPFVQFGTVSSGTSIRARLSRAIQSLPSSIFEAQRPGRVFSSQQRVGTLFYKAGQYGVAGFACGLVGQGIASTVMTLKRKWKSTEEEEVKVPSIVRSAALWAVFMGISSNTRYQIINGLERVVEGSVVSRQVPQVASAFTVGIRFANNVYGGMQFVDWARWAGVQ